MSSSSASLSDYRAALTAPGALLPVLASAVGRFPIAMVGFATLLYVQRASGSFAIAGFVSAGLLAGQSAGAVVQGRLMDRVGPTRPLLVVSALFAVAEAVLVTAVEAGAAVPALVALSLLAGLVLPAVPGASRSLWTRLVPPGRQRDAAYGYEAISLEVFFILGPAVAAFLVATPWPGAGVVVAAAAMVVGTTGFALTGPVRDQEPAPRAPSLLGAIARPGMRTVALASLGFGLVIGSVEVGVPAVTVAMGSATLGGVLLSAWSVASVVAGVAYSLRPWPRPLSLRLPVLLGAFALFVLLMATAAGSLPLLVVAMLLAGATITPQVTAHSLGVEETAPAGTATEGFGWVVTAATLGLAVGQSGAGLAVTSFGPPGAFLAGGVAGIVVAGFLCLRRRSFDYRKYSSWAATDRAAAGHSASSTSA